MVFPCSWCQRNVSPRVYFSLRQGHSPRIIKDDALRVPKTSHPKWMLQVSKISSFCCLLLFRRYDNYKIGTFLLCRSVSRAFEVHVRQWDCGGRRSATACNCGVAAREEGDTVVLDTCNGHFRDSRLQLAIKSTEASPHVKILKSYGGRKITVCGYLSTLVVL